MLLQKLKETNIKGLVIDDLANDIEAGRFIFALNYYLSITSEILNNFNSSYSKYFFIERGQTRDEIQQAKADYFVNVVKDPFQLYNVSIDLDVEETIDEESGDVITRVFKDGAELKSSKVPGYVVEEVSKLTKQVNDFVKEHGQEYVDYYIEKTKGFQINDKMTYVFAHVLSFLELFDKNPDIYANSDAQFPDRRLVFNTLLKMFEIEDFTETVDQNEFLVANGIINSIRINENIHFSQSYLEDLNDFTMLLFKDSYSTVSRKFRIFQSALRMDNPYEEFINQLLVKLDLTGNDKFIDDWHSKEIKNIAKCFNEIKNFKLLIYGQPGLGKTELAKQICKKLGTNLYSSTLQNQDKTLPSGNVEVPDQTIAALNGIEHAIAKNGILLLDDCESILNVEDKFKAAVNRFLENSAPAIFIVNQLEGIDPAFIRRFNYVLGMELPPLYIKKKVLSTYFPDFSDEVNKLILNNSATIDDIISYGKFYQTTNDVETLKNKVIYKNYVDNTIRASEKSQSFYDIQFPEASASGLESIIGYDDVKKDLNKIMNDVNGTGSSSKGFILKGAPGSGKTSFIRKFANQNELPVISVLTSMLTGENGSMLIKKIYNLASTMEPCLIMFDEFEKLSIDKNFQIESGGEIDLLSQMLIELDKISEGDKKIYTFGTLNVSRFLDQALTRSGRFEKVIAIDLPLKETRRQMLISLFGDLPHIDRIVQYTYGMNYLDMKKLRENVIDEYGNDFTFDNILAVIYEEYRKNSKVEQVKKYKEMTAFHEAGHAMLAMKAGTDIGTINVIPTDYSLGINVMTPRNDIRDFMMTRQDLLNDVDCSLAGYVAEKVIYNDFSTGASSDFSRASNLVFNNINFFKPEMGLYNQAFMFYGSTFSDNYKSNVEHECRRILNESIDRVETYLKDNIQVLKSLASVLVEKEEIFEDEIKEIIGHLVEQN